MPISEVFNEKCEDGMKRYPDNFFDLAIVDPPYGIGEDGRKTKGRAVRKDGSFINKIDKRNGRKIVIKPKSYCNSRYDSFVPEEDYFNELFRVSKNQIIWGVNNFPYHFGAGRIFWNKCVSGDFSDGEIAYCSLFDSVRMFTYMWSGFKQGESIINGSKMQGNNTLWEHRIHPNHKPIKLYTWTLMQYAKYGDKIIDTHLGSQSHRIAAYKLGFDFWGWEIDKDYFDEGNERFKKAIDEPFLQQIEQYKEQKLF